MIKPGAPIKRAFYIVLQEKIQPKMAAGNASRHETLHQINPIKV